MRDRTDTGEGGTGETGQIQGREGQVRQDRYRGGRDRDR